jgi:hypothetical protein
VEPGGTTWPIRVKPEGTPEDEAMKLDLAPEAKKHWAKPYRNAQR